MHYQRLTDDSSIIVTETGETHLVSSSLQTNRNFRRTRKCLLILLFIQLIVCLILLIIDARLLMRDNVDNYRQGIRSLGPIFISTIYYGCGLIVVYRYHHLGIYVFAWLGILPYLSLCLEVLLNIVSITKYTSHLGQSKIGFYTALMIIIMSVSGAFLMVITLKLAFRLLRLIKIFKRDFMEQM